MILGARYESELKHPRILCPGFSRTTLTENTWSDCLQTLPPEASSRLIMELPAPRSHRRPRTWVVELLLHALCAHQGWKPPAQAAALWGSMFGYILY